MDPYIEVSHVWEDFHQNLITEIQAELAKALPPNYVARAGERGYLVIEPPVGPPEKHRFWSDVSVGTTGEGQKPAATVAPPPVASTSQTNGAPLSMQALTETEYREVFLEIRLTEPEKRLVTCIEVLSPSNKRPGTKGWKLYNRKRRAFLSGKAHFVELDLLRVGRRMPMATPWPDSPYYLLVCRDHEAPYCKVWPAHFRHPVPPIPIPLAPSDPDITLSIQPLIEKIYVRSRYERDIDYRRPLDPPLDSVDEAWLRELVESRLAGGR
jgi:hypothetical protein